MSYSASSLDTWAKGSGRSYGVRVVSFGKRCSMEFMEILVGGSQFRFIEFWIKVVQLLKNSSRHATAKKGTIDHETLSGTKWNVPYWTHHVINSGGLVTRWKHYIWDKAWRRPDIVQTLTSPITVLSILFSQLILMAMWGRRWGLEQQAEGRKKGQT